MKYSPSVPTAPPAAGTRRWLVASLAAVLLLPVAAWRLVPRLHAAPAAHAPPPAAPPFRRPPPRRAVLPVLPALPAPDPAEPEDEPQAQDAGAPVVEEGPPLAGVVLDPDGTPVEGATVACDDRDPPLAAATDADGRFQLAAAAEGCQAIARHDDFAPSDRAALAAGRANTLHLNRPGGIDGDVVDERGAPVAAFVVAVESYRGPSGAPPRRSENVEDPTGAFALPRLPPGEYVLTAGAEGRPPVFSRPVTVEVGRTTHHLRITLPIGATLTGTVLDADTRRPLPGAVVRLDAMTSTNASKILPAPADEAGVYTLQGVPGGPFSIRVTLDGYRTRLVTGITTRGGSSLRQDVELHPAGDGAREELTGIGAYLASAPSGVTIGSVVSGGPADTAGLRPGDRIARIDGADASALPLFACMQQLRGPEGSRVDVQVDRGGRLVDVTIQRRLLAY